VAGGKRLMLPRLEVVDGEVGKVWEALKGPGVNVIKLFCL
jgi:hypothetical protein